MGRRAPEQRAEDHILASLYRPTPNPHAGGMPEQPGRQRGTGPLVQDPGDGAEELGDVGRVQRLERDSAARRNRAPGAM